MTGLNIFMSLRDGEWSTELESAMEITANQEKLGCQVFRRLDTISVCKGSQDITMPPCLVEISDGMACTYIDSGHRKKP
jgi:hypothetical protein